MKTEMSQNAPTEESDRRWKQENLVWTRIYFGREVMERIIETIDRKHALHRRHTNRYIMRAAMAGVIVVLMYLFAYQVNTDLGESFNRGLAKYLTAVSFSMALVLIYFTNSELLTSNFMYFTIGQYYGKIRLRDTAAILGQCLLGNLLGILIIALLVWSAAMVGPSVIENLVHTVNAKTVESGMWLIFVKAIFANYFINIAVIISLQVHECMAKILALLMGVTVFAYMGYEHVIANAALFVVALFFDPAAVSLLHIGKNFVLSLLGNFVGGGLVVGLFYAYLNDSRGEPEAVVRGIRAGAFAPQEVPSRSILDED